MGEYSDTQRAIRCYEKYKEDFELKTIIIKRLFNVPILYIKQSKYEKIYSLFNIIPVVKVENF